jgi:hypothetical protein
MDLQSSPTPKSLTVKKSLDHQVLMSHLNAETLFQDDDDDIVFKPLTEGLGFHQPAKIEVLKSASSTPSLPPTSITPTKMSSTVYHPYQSEDLKRFYLQSQMNPSPQNESLGEQVLVDELLPPAPSTQTDAGIFLKFFAFIVDSIMVTTIVFGMLFASEFFTEVSFLHRFQESEILLNILTLWSVVFISYFTLVERLFETTFGKELLSLKTISEEPMSLQQTLLQAFLVWLGLFSAGLFSLTNVPQKMTGLKTVKV